MEREQLLVGHVTEKFSIEELRSAMPGADLEEVEGAGVVLWSKLTLPQDVKKEGILVDIDQFSWAQISQYIKGLPPDVRIARLIDARIMVLWVDPIGKSESLLERRKLRLFDQVVGALQKHLESTRIQGMKISLGIKSGDCLLLLPGIPTLQK